MLHSHAARCSTPCAPSGWRPNETRSGPQSVGGSNVLHFSCRRRWHEASSSSSSKLHIASEICSRRSSRRSAGANASAEVERSGPEDVEVRKPEPPPFKCLTSWTSQYNNIVILEGAEDSPSHYAGCRILLLDRSGNVHSVYRRATAWTKSYWDEFAAFPAVIPDGPVAILGLGGGTAARLLLELWPSLKLEGYEIDQILVDNAREHLGLAELESPTGDGGVLRVHVGDALADTASVDGGFAGIIVDLFAEGEVLPQLRDPETWLALKSRLRPGGRIMVNCGGACVEKSDSKSDVENGTWTWEDGAASKDATLAAMALSFPGQLNWRKMENSEADNVLALTGDVPDLDAWAAAVAEELRAGILAWKPYK